jgi:hypothetical protein
MMWEILRFIMFENRRRKSSAFSPMRAALQDVLRLSAGGGIKP